MSGAAWRVAARGRAPASVVHDDARVLAFMGMRPTAPGECLVVPKAHVDHFTDGVAHAHLIVVPPHGPHHLTSDRFARIEDGRIVFDLRHVPLADRATLEDHARALRAAME